MPMYIAHISKVYANLSENSLEYECMKMKTIYSGGRFAELDTG